MKIEPNERSKKFFRYRENLKVNAKIKSREKNYKKVRETRDRLGEACEHRECKTLTEREKHVSYSYKKYAHIHTKLQCFTLNPLIFLAISKFLSERMHMQKKYSKFQFQTIERE